MYTIKYNKNNIESLTINLNDIKYMLYDEPVLIHVQNLYDKNKMNEEENITIFNDNNVNLRIINEIINSKWIINKNDIKNIKKEDIINMQDEVDKLMKEYINESVTYKKRKIRYKILLMEHYINSIIKSDKYSSDKTLKLCTNFMNKKYC